MASEPKLRILIVGLNFAPEPIGIGPYTTGLADYLAQQGHAVCVVAGRPYYPDWKCLPFDEAQNAHRDASAASVTRVWHYIPPQPSGLKRIVHLASFTVSSLIPSIRQARMLRPQWVFAVSPSLLAVPTAWLAAKLSGAKLWLHVQDFEVEAAFATGLLRTDNMLSNFAFWLERNFLKLADRVSAISPQMVAKLHEKGVNEGKTFELRNWANHEFAPNAAIAEDYRKLWGLDGQQIALYSGNISNKQGIEIIVEAAKLLNDRPNLTFIICGQGSSKPELQDQMRSMSNVQLHDLQPADRLGGLLALADVHLLPQLKQAADLMLPSKLTNMLQSGRPVVVTTEKGSGLAAEVEDCGLVAPPEDAKAFAKAISAILDDEAMSAQLGKNAAKRAETHWSKTAILGAFENELCEIKDL